MADIWIVWYRTLSHVDWRATLALSVDEAQAIRSRIQRTKGGAETMIKAYRELTR